MDKEQAIRKLNLRRSRVTAKGLGFQVIPELFECYVLRAPPQRAVKVRFLLTKTYMEVRQGKFSLWHSTAESYISGITD
jgi:hypothetical protein